MSPEQASQLLETQAVIMEDIARQMSKRDSSMCPYEDRSRMIDALLGFCAELAQKCATSKRATARIINSLSGVVEFEIYTVQDMNMPEEEVVLDELTERLQQPPIDADFFREDR